MREFGVVVVVRETLDRARKQCAVDDLTCRVKRDVEYLRVDWDIWHWSYKEADDVRVQVDVTLTSKSQSEYKPQSAGVVAFHPNPSTRVSRRPILALIVVSSVRTSALEL